MTATTATPTLDALNANAPTREVPAWGMTVRNQLSVGRAGRAGTRGRSASMVHLVYTTVIVSVVDASKAADVGKLLGAYSCVSGNGQFTATPIDGFDIDAITCKRCKARAEYAVSQLAVAEAV
jgi:hypothetical protein